MSALREPLRRCWSLLLAGSLSNTVKMCCLGLDTFLFILSLSCVLSTLLGNQRCHVQCILCTRCHVHLTQSLPDLYFKHNRLQRVSREPSACGSIAMPRSQSQSPGLTSCPSCPWLVVSLFKSCVFVLSLACLASYVCVSVRLSIDA